MEKYDIYLARVYFKDKPNEFKDRPVLLLDNDFLIPIAPIGSQIKNHPTEYVIKNWAEAGLDKPSYIGFSDKELINVKERIKDISLSGEGVYIGHLSKEDIDKIKELKLVESLLDGKIKYHYHGPVYHFHEIISRDFDDWTEAFTSEEALRNLTSKAKKKLGYKQKSNITLNKSYLEFFDPEEEPLPEIKKCEKCGMELNDVGECPKCDLHDESILKESNSEKVTLEYSKLPVKVWFKLSNADETSPEEWDYYEEDISYEYEVDKDSLKDNIYDLILNREEYKSLSTEELIKYIDDNFGELLSNNYQEILDIYKDSASEEAESKNQDDYRESLKKQVEGGSTMEDKRLKESKEELLKKYPDAYIPEIDEKTGLPILPDDLFGDWEY